MSASPLSRVTDTRDTDQDLDAETGADRSVSRGASGSTGDLPRLRGVTSGTARRRPDWILIGVMVVVVITVLLIALQFVVLLVGSVRVPPLTSGAFTWSYLTQILADPMLLKTAVTTLEITLGTLLVMLCISIPAAWLFARTDFSGNRMILVLFTIVMSLPGFLVAISYTFMLNPTNGVINSLLRVFFPMKSGPIDVYSIGWIAFLQGLGMAGAAFFMMVPTFRAINSSLEEAALTSGLRQRTVLWRVILPLALPAIVATASYYFVVSMELFDYAAVLGLPHRIFVFSTWIFQLLNPSVGSPQYGAASVVGLLFTIAAILLVVLYVKIVGTGERFAVLGGKQGVQNRIHLSRGTSTWTWVGLILFALVAFIGPLLSMFWASLMPYFQPPSAKAFASISFDSYHSAFQEMGSLLGATLWIVIGVPVVSVLLALCAAWFSVRTRLRGRRVVDFMIMAAIGTPSIVAGLAFLNLGIASYRWVPLYGTIFLVVIAMGARYVTWAYRSLSTAMLQIAKELDESAAVSGILRGRAFVSIMVPIVVPAIGFSLYWVAMLALRDLSMPVLLTRGDTKVIASDIYGFYSGGSTNVAAAMGIILLLGILALMGLQLLMARIWRQVGGKSLVKGQPGD